jgi:hypothetical protein
MIRMSLLLFMAIVQSAPMAYAQDHGRIKRKPPTPAEAERIVSDMVMNDGSLQKGDVVATDHGFFLFRGPGPDGITGDFVPIPNPLSTKK